MTLILLISAALSFLAGGVNPAIILSKLVYGEDIRDKGSKNPGFTNFKRVYGSGFISWLVLLLDVLKTAVPVFVTALVSRAAADAWQLGACWSGLFCMLGHCFPVWYGFRGGKAFIAGFATTWFVDWRMALIAMAIFFIVLAATRYMSVSSCTAAFSCPIILLILGAKSPWVYVIVAVSALLIIVRHYPNFVKLRNGTESKFSLRSKKS